MAQGTTKGVPIDVDPLLNLNSDLVVPSQKAIKAYVDAKKSAADSDYVNVSGDTMTGYLLLHADPSTNLHAVTKQYVDNYVNGLDYKTAAHVGTVAALPAYTVSVNKLVLTGTANGAIPNATFDNHAPLAGERVLVKNETSTLTPNNGIYVLTQVGDVNTPFILTRSADADSSAELGEATLSIINGDTLSNTIWHCTPASVPITIGTTNLTFIQVGSGSVGTGVENELTYWASPSSLGSLTTATYPTLTELAHVKGVTSPIQTQFSNKEDTITTLAANKGGTGFSSYTIGDLLYANGTTSLAKLEGVATGNALISGGLTTAPSWGKITESHISLSDVTTLNVSTTAHGFVPKAPNSTGVFLRGDGTWAAVVNSGTIASGTARRLAIYSSGTGLTDRLDLFDGTRIVIAPSTGHQYTIDNVGAAASFVMTQGTQIIAGAKTFSSDTIFSGDIAVNGGDITTTSTGTATLFNTNATTLNIGGAATTSTLFPAVITLNLGNTATAAQTVNMFGASTGASTYNFAHGVTASATTKTINIGTLGANGSTTNINLGSAVAGALGTVTVQGGGSGTVPNLSIATNSSYSWIRIGTGTGAFPTISGTRSTGDRIVFSDNPYASIGYVSAGSSPINAPSFWLQTNTVAYPLGGSSMNFITGSGINSSTISGGFNFFVPNAASISDDVGFGPGVSPPIFTIFRGAPDSNNAGTTGMIIRAPRYYNTANNKTISGILPSTPSAGIITVTLNSVANLSVDQVVRITGVVGSTGYNNTVSRIIAINIGANTIQLYSTVTETYGSGGTLTPVHATFNAGTSVLGIYFEKNDVLQVVGNTRVPSLTPVITFTRVGVTSPTETFELLNHSTAIGTLNFGTFFNTFTFGTGASTINIGDCRTPGPSPVAQTINIGTTYSFQQVTDGFTRNINLGHNPANPGGNSGIYASGGTSYLNIRIGQTGTVSGSNHQVTNIGFYGVTPVPKAAAYTQTYNTPARTLTQTTMTDPAAYATGAFGYSTGAMASAIHAEVIALRANMIVTQNVLNSLIDDLQALGLVG